MKICRPRPQLVFTFDNRFSSTGWAAQQSVRYIIFRLQASYLSATSHTGRKSCRSKVYIWNVFGIDLFPLPLSPHPPPVLTRIDPHGLDHCHTPGQPCSFCLMACVLHTQSSFYALDGRPMSTASQWLPLGRSDETCCKGTVVRDGLIRRVFRRTCQMIDNSACLAKFLTKIKKKISQNGIVFWLIVGTPWSKSHSASVFIFTIFFFGMGYCIYAQCTHTVYRLTIRRKTV